MAQCDRGLERLSELPAVRAGQILTEAAMLSGDRVRVIGGPYRRWQGEVRSVDAAERRVMVLIPVFAKPTVVALSPSQIEPV